MQLFKAPIILKGPVHTITTIRGMTVGMLRLCQSVWGAEMETFKLQVKDKINTINAIQKLYRKLQTNPLQAMWKHLCQCREWTGSDAIRRRICVNRPIFTEVCCFSPDFR